MAGTIVPLPVPSWTPVLLIFVPLLVCLRYGRYVSALPPEDFDESNLIASIRESLHRGSGDVSDRIRSAREQLRSGQPPAQEWQAVRKQLLEQLDLLERHARGDRLLTIEEAAESAHRTFGLWKAAIAARSRFFR